MTLSEAIYKACLHAATVMGDKVKGMFCFVKNWPSPNSIDRIKEKEPKYSKQL